MRAALFDIQFRQDLAWWIREDREVSLRLLKLVEATVREPFGGIGKPEPLKYRSGNYWSKRLTQGHRLVYVVYDDRIEFLQARLHY